MVHDLVDTTGLSVCTWGNVEAEHPAEVVEIIVTAFAAPIATKVVDFLYARIRERRNKGDQALMAVTMRRPDGAELVWEFRRGVSAEMADAEFAKFLEGKAVSRVLGAQH